MMLGQALVFQKRYDEARAILTRALEIRERVYGPTHPRVASAVNELGTLALKTGKLDDAEASFRRMVDIYKKAYNDHHYLISIALSNLASVYMERKQYARAEQFLAEAVQRYATILPAEHLNVAIARTKLGRAIARQGRYRDAERESLAAYRALMKQSTPPLTRLQDVRKDLVDIYEALGEKDKAQQFRTEPAPAVASVAAK
jgi:serine/threonine-protein kinase